MTECIFCKIAKKEIDSDLIYEDENVVAFSDLNPQAPFHILVIPKEHVESMNEVKNCELFSNIFSAIQKIAKSNNINEYRTVINTGLQAGQTVFHLHVHMLSGRQFTWPAG